MNRGDNAWISRCYSGSLGGGAAAADEELPLGLEGERFAPPLLSIFFLFLNGRDDDDDAPLSLMLLSSLLDFGFSCSLFDDMWL